MKYLGCHFSPLNDFLTEINSRKDRHGGLGEGTMGFEALHRFLHRFITHPAFAALVVNLETPRT